jgi:hypothetical protein
MRLLLISATLAIAGCVVATPLLAPEPDFLGIPGIESLNAAWLYSDDSLAHPAFLNPCDVEVLRLSPSDYRVIILDSGGKMFTVLRMDQLEGLPPREMVRSGEYPDSSASPVAMCQVLHGTYFNATSDRIAVAFRTGGAIGVYRFDRWTSQLFLVRTVRNTKIAAPVGIFWAFGDFFIADESTQAIYRTDSLGVIKSQYGHRGYFGDGYDRISDISGYVDDFGVAHLFVGDGSAERVDHIIATAYDDAMVLQSQALAADSIGMFTQEVAYLPGAGVIGLNQFIQRLTLYHQPDSLRVCKRDDSTLVVENDPVFHIDAVAGRLVMARLDGLNPWSLCSFTVPGAVLDNPRPLPRHHWTVQDSPIIVSDTFRVVNGDTLMIDAGVDVQFDDGGAIVVDDGGALFVNGTANHRVTFAAWDSAESWGGITANGELWMDYADIRDTGLFCVWTNKPTGPVEIRDSYFDGSKIQTGGNALRLWNNPDVKQKVYSCTIDHVPLGSGLYLWGSYVAIDSLKVIGCDFVNSYIKQTTGNFRNCYFGGRTSYYGVLFNGAGCTPNFRCCEFNGVSARGTFNATLYAGGGTAPTFGYEGISSGVSNKIVDSCDILLKMSGNGVKPIIDNVLQNGGPGGRNDWYQSQSGALFLVWTPPYPSPFAPYPAEKQYWNMCGNTTPTINDFFPRVAGDFDFSSNSTTPFGLCGGASASTDPGPPRRLARLDDAATNYDSLFITALSLEINDSFPAAQSLFHEVALNAGVGTLRWQAMTHVTSTQRQLDPVAGDVWIPGLIDVLIAADSFAYDSRVYGERLRASYRVDRTEYTSAVDTLTALLASELTYQDSLLVADDLVGVQISMNGGAGGGHLDDRVVDRIPAELRIHNLAHGMALDQELIRRLAARTAGSVTGGGAIPTAYRLYQNYPNPFNPTTEIVFDLPVASNVKLQVFNTLGQLVTTVVDEARVAGQHKIRWDASELASGLYIYRLEANGFVDAKKMVLIR